MEIVFVSFASATELNRTSNEPAFVEEQRPHQNLGSTLFFREESLKARFVSDMDLGSLFSKLKMLGF